MPESQFRLGPRQCAWLDVNRFFNSAPLLVQGKASRPDPEYFTEVIHGQHRVTVTNSF